MPLFSLFQPLLTCSGCSHSPEMQGRQERNGSPFALLPECSQPCTIKRGTEAHKERGTRKGKGKGASKQASKPLKKGTPPYCREQAALPLITNSRQKISKKSPWGILKKISEKFFVGMFRGKEKPLALSQRKGDCVSNLINNGNRVVSNLAMQINQKRKNTKTKGKGR